MKEMQELIMVKGQDNPELSEKLKKRKLEKKKIMKNEQINENRVHELEEEGKKDLEQN